MIWLKKKLLNTSKSIKKKKDRCHIKKIGLFGSLARGESGDNSDIDIVVVIDKPDIFYLVGIKQDLEESFHRHVDVVRYRKGMNKFLKKRIDKEAVYV